MSLFLFCSKHDKKGEKAEQITERDDLDIDTVGEDRFFTSDNDYEDPVDNLMSCKKRKRKYSEVIDNKDDDLPYKYRHLRDGLRSVKPEVYTVMQILQTKYHLSHAQSEGAIITVGNKLFGREEYGEWKAYNVNCVSINQDFYI